MRKAVILVVPKLLLLTLAACGGGGGDVTPPPDPDPPAISYTPGVFPASSQFAARCQNPRTGRDPQGRPWPDVAGSALHEKFFLRSWTNELYLWADEVIDRNPANTGGSHGGVLQYFNLLKTELLTDSGQPRDQFHFTYDTDDYNQLVSGVVAGYGISWVIVRGAVPREIRVESVQAGSAAAQAGIRRGALLVSINGVDVINDNTAAGGNAALAAMYEPSPGATYNLVLRDRGSATNFAADLVADETHVDPVPLVSTIQTDDARVGYLLFNDHNLPAEAALVNAVTQLAAEHIDELVLDLRYNGGGYLDIASELAYMIAGPAATQNRTFELLQFHPKHGGRHPLTGQLIQPLPFRGTAGGFSLPSGTPLPHLGLARVVVLTSDRTCSASESIINGLRGIGIEVIQVGGRTCGKPYGFYPRDNCGTTYFTVMFRGVNDMNFGDYADGFSATRVTGHPLTNLPGCGAADDLTRDLGDPQEGQLATALNYLATRSCPVAAALSVRPQATLWPTDAPVYQAPRRPWQNNRILR